MKGELYIYGGIGMMIVSMILLVLIQTILLLKKRNMINDYAA